ncbi:apoptosis 1 inhibitor-like protein [Dinothrombium tinctorium]|uniref:Apoptosis 1 inhibitor-like protein n=1 Tax=Dinothrombium tinctorium TaxID=1965070 RepID=A0A3S3NP39_9ACAR|nr:apoptosis 1 inhibitor-like protein [Dinothrombium tinctorium]
MASFITTCFPYLCRNYSGDDEEEVPPINDNNDIQLQTTNDEFIPRLGSKWKDERLRLKTFEEWSNENVSKEKLAKAGFIYTNINDRVICVYCGDVYCQWLKNDDPLIEHKKSFQCPFINGYDVGNLPIGEDPFKGLKRKYGHDVVDK